MAATLARVQEGEDVWGKTRAVTFDVTGDTSYPAGGYAITPADLGLKFIQGAVLIGVNTAGLVYFASWNLTTGKLAFVTAGAEGSGNLTTITLRVRFFGQ